MTIQSIQIIGITVPEYNGNDVITQFCNKYAGQIINFYTSNLDELGVIGKHRVLPVPTILFLSNTKVIGRVVKDIPILSDLEHIFTIIKESNLD